MRYLITNLPLELGEERQPLEGILARVLGGQPGEYSEASLERLSLDARHKGAIRFLAALAFQTGRALGEPALPAGARLEPGAAPVAWTVAAVTRPPRVVVVGSGPAGTFCALRLLDYGITPVVLERGAPMSERVRAVAGLWNDAVLDPEANAQFGEGGAGTFSDGKLTTRIGHPAIRYVIEPGARCSGSARSWPISGCGTGRWRRRCWPRARRSPATPWCWPRATAPGTLSRCCTAWAWPCARSRSPWGFGWSIPRS